MKMWTNYVKSQGTGERYKGLQKIKNDEQPALSD
jgi:hypothetical protein